MRNAFIKRLSKTVVVFLLVCNSHAQISNSNETRRGFVAVSIQGFHPSDFLLLDTYNTGTGLNLTGNLFFAGLNIGVGLSYQYTERTSENRYLGSITTHGLALSLHYSVAQFRKPIQIEPYFGVGIGLLYFQENTIPTVVLKFSDTSSDADRVLLNYRIQFGVPLRFTQHVGILLLVENSFAWLDKQETSVSETFDVGGIYYGVGLCYYF